MDRELHEQLVKNTEELRRLVSQCSTEEIAGMCSAYALNRGTPSERTTILASPLTSPARQIFFLLGLMLTTSEPVNPGRFDRQEWQKTVELLNAIYSAHTAMFLPKGANVTGLTDERTRALEVAAPAFLHYFNTGILASADQVSARIRRYIVPFDAQLKDELGISASEALDIAIWITEYFQKSADSLHKAAVEEKEARITLLSRAAAEGWDLDRLQKETQKEKYLSRFGDLFRELNSFLKVSHDSLVAQFGKEIADSYWTTFVSERGEVASFTYLTERNIAEEKPLFQIEEGVAFCPVSNALYWAILKVTESHLNSSPSRDNFLKKRDRTLELEVEQTLQRIFGSAAVFYSQVFETETLQHEHDLIVVWNSSLFVIESKASSPIEPFRDPERAFTRLRRAF